MDEDDRNGGRGDWIGLLGFSQGAKICGSLLLRQEAQLQASSLPSSAYRFAVLLAGRAPLVNMQDGATGIQKPTRPAMLQLPTIHVHGMRDPGLRLHRQLLEKHCAKGTTSLIDWDGDHGVPIKGEDVRLLVREVLRLADEA